MKLNQQIGTRIRELRLLANLTQEELAFKSGLNQTDIYRFENDKRKINLDHIEKIAGGLNISTSRLFISETTNNEQSIRKVLDRLYMMDDNSRDRLFDFLSSLNEEIDFELLQKALKVAKLGMKK